MPAPAVAFMPSLIRAQTSDSCARRAELKMPGPSLEITKTENFPAAPMPKSPISPGYTRPIPAHCRVTMVLKPTDDSNIHVGLWMPAGRQENHQQAIPERLDGQVSIARAEKRRAG